MRKEGGDTCRAIGEDMEFISDKIRAKRASAGHIGDMLIRGTEVSVSREGFTLGAKAQEIGRVWVKGEETEIESRNEKVCPKEVGREERDVGRKPTAQTPWVGDGLYVRRPCERAASAIVSLFDPPGGMAFSYPS